MVSCRIYKCTDYHKVAAVGQEVTTAVPPQGAAVRPDVPAEPAVPGGAGLPRHLRAGAQGGQVGTGFYHDQIRHESNISNVVLTGA